MKATWPSPLSLRPHRSHRPTSPLSSPGRPPLSRPASGATAPPPSTLAAPTTPDPNTPYVRWTVRDAQRARVAGNVW
ncbi:hypothetical protein GUJ93_ZPchr0008g12230 [Zizania palustris]|uniref:Uncharacterized protein n=1 Tax=Zizania palustris TaxID=103762 RepID=A0A8J5RMW3_ZIZPA|nr:hypothetical protein GUJ93_ZPchr0008g12230 [Zizania palustris]